jgi:hypothetical protein
MKASIPGKLICNLALLPVGFIANQIPALIRYFAGCSLRGQISGPLAQGKNIRCGNFLSFQAKNVGCDGH